MDSKNLTRELRSSVATLGNVHNMSSALTALKDVRNHVEQLEAIGAKEEAYLCRHQVAIALREFEATDEAREQLKSELRSVAGKKAIEVANAPTQFIRR
jgi:hypothetical protein